MDAPVVRFVGHWWCWQADYEQLIDVLGQERHEWRKCPHEDEENLEKSVDCAHSVFHVCVCLAFEPFAIKPNIPIREVLKERQQARQDRV